MRPPSVAILGAAGFLLGAAWVGTAMAQGVQRPRIVPEASDVEGAREEDVQASPAPREPRWGVSFRAQEARDTNPSLQPAARGSWVTSLRVGAFRSLQGGRSRHLLSADADLERYHQLRGLDKVRWSAAASSGLRLSPRSRLDLDASVMTTRARDLQTFLDTGLLLPATPVRRLAASAGLSRRLSPATTVSAWGRYQRVTFESEDLADGFEGAVGATLGRRFGERHTGSLSYGFRRSESGEQADSFHAASVSWTGVLGRRVKADASLGGVYNPAATGHDLQMEGGSGLAYHGEAVELGARYARAVGQAFGYSIPQVSDVGTVRLDWRPARALVLATSASYGWSRDPLRRSFDFRSRTHAAEVHWTLRPLLTVSCGYVSLHRDSPDESLTSTDHVWRTSLSLGRNWP